MSCNLLTTRATTITWDIAKGPLIIRGNSADNYIITGTTTTNYVVVEAGYKGVITLRNVNISITGNHSPIFIKGQDDCSNLTPITIVDIILEGENILQYSSDFGEVCEDQWSYGCLNWKEELVDVMYHDCIAYEEKTGTYLQSVCVREEEKTGTYLQTVCLRYEEQMIDGYVYQVCVEDREEWVEYTYQECVDWKDELIEYTYEECAAWETRVEKELVKTDCLDWGEGWFEQCQWGWCNGYAALHVDQGAQINISAIAPSDNSSGTLSAISTGWEGGGAGIGASYINSVKQATAEANIIGDCDSPATTTGGNIVISSGTVTAQGGQHAAGIGGGWHAYYDGMIVIYGGIVNSSATFHAAGIGSGCPTAHGVVSCYSPNGAVIVLPPAQIYAIGAGNQMEGLRFDLALAGADNIIYIGDPEKPLNTVHTEDFTPYANIYVDLSESPNIEKVITAIVPPDRLDINKVKFGQADKDGIFQFHGYLNDYITFFTDAPSIKPETMGRPYNSKRVILTENLVDRTVILEMLDINMAIESIPSIPLIVGYTASEASTNAFHIIITYSDYIPLQNIVFDLAGGAYTDFSTTGMKFFSSDGITEISTPTTLKEGDVIHIVIPLEIGKPVDSYADVFRFIGTWSGQSTGYIRLVVTQNVGNPNSIVAIASPDEGGSTSGSGIYPEGIEVTLTAIPNEGFIFMRWMENDVEVSVDADYTFMVTEPRSLVAIFERYSRVNVDINNIDYGAATGSGLYEPYSIVQVEAFVNNCYRFANWTIDGVVVSVDNPYIFTVAGNVNLVANFYALDFDTYAPMLWDNTFMLNLRLLAEESYEVTGCKWFKDGMEERDTRTVSEYSYSAGPNITDLLEMEPHGYMFRLITENYGELCSTQKIIIPSALIDERKSADILAYPNPLPSGSQLTIEGVTKDSPIFVYNQAGVCVYSSVAAGSVVMLTLPVPDGIYLVRIGEKGIKIVVSNDN